MTSTERPLIIHVIHHLVMGGMENGLVNLINHLPESSFRHAIVCIENDSDFRERIIRNDVDIIVMHRSHIGVWTLRKQLVTLFRRLKPAIVHSRNLSGLDALLPARLAGVRYCIHSEHGRDVDDLDGSNKKLALLRALHRPLVNRYASVSKDLQHYLIQRVGINASSISQIYNGVDTDKFFPADHKPHGVIPTHYIGNDKLLIGTVGRLQAVKDQATLIRAFAALLKQYPNLADRVHLAIVGAGPLLDDLTQLAASLNLTEKIWLPGKADNVPDVLRCFDLFILPSLAEGISNTILEAMASGLPVIATAVGGNVELISEQYNGSLFTPGDVNGLRDLIANYLNDITLLKQHGLQARQTALKQFSLKTMLNEYQLLYETGL